MAGSWLAVEVTIFYAGRGTGALRAVARIRSPHTRVLKPVDWRPEALSCGKLRELLQPALQPLGITTELPGTHARMGTMNLETLAEMRQVNNACLHAVDIWHRAFLRA